MPCFSGELPSRSITLYADSISPQSGSVHGGFLLTLSGKGFGTDMDEVEVEIESHGCQIESLNNEEIVCQVERTAHKETISNLGTTGTLPSDTKVSKTDRTADIEAKSSFGTTGKLQSTNKISQTYRTAHTETISNLGTTGMLQSTNK